MKDASTDATEICGWLERWPDANIGVLTGRACGLVVLDVDPRHGGKESLADLERLHGPLPPTLTVETGGGGHHYYFCHTTAVVRSRLGIRPGLDLKGEGGYVVAPPSVHASGGSYRVSDGTPTSLAPVPEWLIGPEDEAARQESAIVGPRWDDTIPEGERNAALASLAGSMRARGMTPAAIEAALLHENRTRCIPPLPEEEVRRIAGSIGRYPAGTEAGTSEAESSTEAGLPPQATRLVALADDAELFHSPDGEAYATFEVAGRRETALLRSRTFRAWLVQRFFATERRAPAGHALQDAFRVLEGLAIHAAPCFLVNVRLAAHAGAIYLDLANARGEAVEATPGRWQIVSAPPVRFLRPGGLAPLPMPIGGGAVSELRPFVNVPADDDAVWQMLVGWLLAALRPVGPYPILILKGEAGSAKTTTGRVLRALVDPSRAPMRAEPRSDRDLVIAAANSWVTAIDNVSHLPPWLADALCRLSTGGGLSTRKLYSDAEEQIFDVQRPVILTGIEDPTTRGDLLDRAVILRLPSIPERRRRAESQMWLEFAACQARLLGALLDALTAAMANLPTTRLASTPRMVDFALLGAAAEVGLGWEPGAFMGAYESNRGFANDLALESTPIVEALFRLTDTGPWTGSASQLLDVLAVGLDERTKKQQGWPSNARGMRSALERLVPNLRAAGIDVAFPPRQGRIRPIEVKRVESGPSRPSSPSPGQPGAHGDGAWDAASRDDPGDGVPAAGLELPGRPSSGNAGGGGSGDGCDGGDGRARTLSATASDVSSEPEPGGRPKRPLRVSGAVPEGSRTAPGEEATP